MLIEDFSHNFDTLVNSYSTRGQFGDTEPDIRFNEHEKSVFLTKAQEQFVIGLYTGRNATRESFEQTEEMRRYLSSLVREATLTPIVTTNGNVLGMESNSKFFTLPEDLWFITYESVKVSDAQCEGMSVIDVYPIRQDEYHKLKKNPFRGANNRRVLRLDLSENNVEIISTQTVSEYYVRYLQKLHPIILIDLSEDGLAINGESAVRGCELHESLHQRILDLAVQMALQSRGVKTIENRE